MYRFISIPLFLCYSKVHDDKMSAYKDFCNSMESKDIATCLLTDLQVRHIKQISVRKGSSIHCKAFCRGHDVLYIFSYFSYFFSNPRFLDFYQKVQRIMQNCGRSVCNQRQI